MNSQQISMFLSLTETLSFTKSARDIHVTQPAISRQISALEEELGFLLFSRDRHHVALTDAGLIMKRHFEREENERRAAVERASRVARDGKKSISLRLLTYMDSGRVLRTVSKLTDISFYIESQDVPCQVSDIINGKYDVGVCFSTMLARYPGYDLSYRELAPGQDCFLYSPLLEKGGVKPEEMPVCLVSDDMLTPANFPPARMRSCGLEYRQIKLVPNMTSVMTYVQTGLAATIFKDFSLPYLSFEHKAVPLDSWQSIGLTWLNDNKRPYLKGFLDMCFREK